MKNVVIEKWIMKYVRNLVIKKLMKQFNNNIYCTILYCTLPDRNRRPFSHRALPLDLWPWLWVYHPEGIKTYNELRNEMSKKCKVFFFPRQNRSFGLLQAESYA